MTSRAVSNRNIASTFALEMIAAATTAASRLGKPMAIAVVDSGGNLTAFVRMDGAPLLASNVAKQKAWCAVAWNKPTGEWHDFIREDPILLAGVPRIEGMTVLPGGHPVHMEGHLIGGIGVSGSHYAEDDDVARAGLAAIGSGG